MCVDTCVWIDLCSRVAGVISLCTARYNEVLQEVLSWCGSDTSPEVSCPGWCRRLGVASSPHGSDVRIVFPCKPDGSQGSV